MKVDPWLSSVVQRLEAERYTVYEGGEEGAGDFALVARRSRFELSKFGYSETFFVFDRFNSILAKRMREFSADAFAHALRTRTCPLPCGLFEFVACFAVALADQAEAAAVKMVRQETPPRHWAAVEFPVIFEQRQQKLHYLEKTPLWGSAYYRGFRKTVNRLLGEVSAD
jgi:hypothetical protein